MKIFDKKIKKAIKNTLTINESLVAQQKRFDIRTDFLSPGNLGNHIELYEGYIRDFNLISAKLDTVDRKEVFSNHSDFKNLKHDETYNLNAAYLHELYFANIGDPNSQITMDSLSYMRLARDFGSFDNWQNDFIACCQSSRCGWAITYLNTYTQTLMNCVIDLHSQNVPAGMYPVIVMDLWQHAYYKDYLKDSKTYVNAMMKQFRWSVIEKRINKSDKIAQILRG
jgi:Fe-Mn family superoxide dismutase|tara:strand:- start:13527 stop:14201 length:675 start_codon:yes stop_codon:yes gene_type:complete